MKAKVGFHAFARYTLARIVHSPIAPSAGDANTIYFNDDIGRSYVISIFNTCNCTELIWQRCCPSVSYLPDARMTYVDQTLPREPGGCWFDFYPFQVASSIQ